MKIGHGRHYQDVPPIRGVYRGPAVSDLSATVQMTRMNGDCAGVSSAQALLTRSSASSSSAALKAPSIRVLILPSSSITNSHGSVGSP